MKTVLAPLFALALLACSKTPSETQTATLEVKGMTCETCVQGITGTLARTPGVVETSVSLENESAVVAYDPALIDASQLAGRIDQLGFEAEVVPADVAP